MIVLIGASASGKTRIAKILCDTYGYNKCITTTTRPIRNNERQDYDYHFVTKETFNNMYLNGEFIEATDYQDNLYGIQKKDIDLKGVVIVDPIGANSLIEKMNHEVFIVYIESNINLRKSRMIQRGDPAHSVNRRLESDNAVFQPEKIKRIDLLLKNEVNSLIKLAEVVHQHYQSYLRNSKLV